MLLFYSSFVFLTNVATTLYNQYFLYSFLFFMLSITSLVNHYDPTPYTTRVDQVFVAAIVLYGGWVFYNKMPAAPLQFAAVVAAFLLTAYLYTYGFCTQQYCFHSDKTVGDQYHCLLHLVASFGHHLIAFL